MPRAARKALNLTHPYCTRMGEAWQLQWKFLNRRLSGQSNPRFEWWYPQGSCMFSALTEMSLRHALDSVSKEDGH